MWCNLKDITYEAIVTTDTGRQMDLSPCLQQLQWEEQDGQLAQKAALKLINIKVDGQYLTSWMKLGAKLTIIALMNKESHVVFEGSLWTWDYTGSGDKSFCPVFYDKLIYLQKSKDIMYYTAGCSTSFLLGDICSRWGIPLSFSGKSVAHARYKMPGEPISEFILQVLDESYKKGAPRCVVRWENNRVNILPLGGNEEIFVFEAGRNAVQANHTITMDNMVTRVRIISKSDRDTRPPVEETRDGQTQFGILQDIYKRDKETTLGEALAAAGEILARQGKPEETGSLQCADVPTLRKGHKVKIEAGSLYGYYMVKGVLHNGKEKTMVMELEPA